ncbi:hypothetical protein ACTFIT_009796 [Dictyostelium discoideum]
MYFPFIKSRDFNYDLKSGRCIQPLNKTLFSYLFHSNQLSKALNDIDYFNNPGERDHRNYQDLYDPDHHLLERIGEEEFGLEKVTNAMSESNKNFTKEEIQDFNTIIKLSLLMNVDINNFINTIIKFNFLDDLEILYHFLNSIGNSKKFGKQLSQLKDIILSCIANYNRINCLKLLWRLDQYNKSFFDDRLLTSIYKEFRKSRSMVIHEIENILRNHFKKKIQDEEEVNQESEDDENEGDNEENKDYEENENEDEENEDEEDEE